MKNDDIECPFKAGDYVRCPPYAPRSYKVLAVRRHFIKVPVLGKKKRTWAKRAAGWEITVAYDGRRVKMTRHLLEALGYKRLNGESE